MSQNIVHIENLVKRYGDLIALNHLNLDIREGEVFGLLGPNGSGKTTAINCMLSLLKYDKGTIEIFGEAMSPDNYQVKKQIGIVLQNVAVFEELTVTGKRESSLWRKQCDSSGWKITEKCVRRSCREVFCAV